MHDLHLDCITLGCEDQGKETMGNNLQKALQYFSQGLIPIPLCWPDEKGKCACGRRHTGKSIGKAPLLGAAYQKVIPTIDMLKKWWEKWPEANIGILLKPSHLLVVDLDGPEAIAEAQRLGLPGCPFVTTGNGEHHYYLADGVVGRTTHRGKSHRIDVLADGYVVAPPSRHANGSIYEWSREDALLELPAPPEWAKGFLLNRQDNPVSGAPAGGMSIDISALDIPERIKNLIVSGNNSQYPSRSEALFAVIAALMDAGYDDAVITDVVWAKPIGAKAREQGRDWLAGELSRAHAKAPLGQSGKREVKKSGEQEAAEDNRISPATRLVRLAEKASLFHTTGIRPEAYAVLPISDHKEVWSLHSREFHSWISHLYYNEIGTAPSAQILRDALNILESKALFDGPEYPVFTRIAMVDGNIYVDLCNDQWSVIEITPDGWRILPQSPVHFRRTISMDSLATPVKGGSVSELLRVVNIRREDLPLVVAWLLMAFNPNGPYPILCLHGGQGCAKSSTARVLRRLVDPNVAPLRTAPKDEHDLVITASSSWVFCLDNLSHIREWLSDALCRLATGGGFATRTLYSNSDETIFEVKRPILLTGIVELTTRGDLQERALSIALPEIADDKRRVEGELQEELERIIPRVFGALLDAVSCALREKEHVKLANLPRMADFAVWATAAEPVLPWKPGTFLASYSRNRASSVNTVLDADLLTPLILDIAEENGWSGTAQELLEILESRANERETHSRQWPSSPKVLGDRVRYIAPALRQIGWGVQFSRTKAKRLITIKRIESTLSPASSATPADKASSNDADYGNNDKMTHDGVMTHTVMPSVIQDDQAPISSCNISGRSCDAGDAGDALNPPIISSKSDGNCQDNEGYVMGQI